MYKDLSDSVKKLYGAHMSFIRLCINKNNRHVTDIYFVISDIKMAKMGCRENINWKHETRYGKVIESWEHNIGNWNKVKQKSKMKLEILEI